MRAQVGNWLEVHSRVVDAPPRYGEIVEVPHADGSPPYVVRWLDDEHPSLVFPGQDAVVTTEPRHVDRPVDRTARRGPRARTRSVPTGARPARSGR